jgi:hypothetical protein
VAIPATQHAELLGDAPQTTADGGRPGSDGGIVPPPMAYDVFVP